MKIKNQKPCLLQETIAQVTTFIRKREKKHKELNKVFPGDARVRGPHDKH